jgi:hypothetical protein
MKEQELKQEFSVVLPPNLHSNPNNTIGGNFGNKKKALMVATG